jgi:hypothetical protein
MRIFLEFVGEFLFNKDSDLTACVTIKNSKEAKLRFIIEMNH